MKNFKRLLNITGCIITICFGLLGFFFPEKASHVTGLQPTNASAIAELRGTLGGSFLVMGIYPLITKNPISFQISGLFWWGAAAGRLFSLFVDQGFRETKNYGGLFLETFIGALLLMGCLRPEKDS